LRITSSQSEGRIAIVTKRGMMRPMIDEILRQGGFAPGEDPVKALIGAVTGKSSGAAVPAAASTPEKPNAADL
jgi:flotillin